MIRKTIRGRGRARGRTTKKSKQPPEEHRSVEEDSSFHEEHRYYSKMMFDGNTLVTESKKDNEPVKRRKYTLKQLRREIPLGEELIVKYLDGRIPKGLSRPVLNEVPFHSALPSPSDLGLLPPREEQRRGRSRKSRLVRDHREDRGDNRENMRIIIHEMNNRDNEERDYERPRHLFDLP